MHSRVFMIEPTRVDSSAARDYGEIVYVFDPDVRRCSAFRSVDYGRAVLTRLQEQSYDPVNDYVCVSGALLTVGIALVAIAQSHARFQLLLFNSIDGKYVPRMFDISDWN